MRRIATLSGKGESAEHVPAAAAVETIHNVERRNSVGVSEIHLPPLVDPLPTKRVHKRIVVPIDCTLGTNIGDVVVGRTLRGGLAQRDVGEGGAVLNGLELDPRGASGINGGDVDLACAFANATGCFTAMRARSVAIQSEIRAKETFGHKMCTNDENAPPATTKALELTFFPPR